MVMPSQQGSPQQSGLSLPLQHSIHCIRCGATTNFNVKCLVYNCRQPKQIFVCEVQNEIFYTAIRVFPGILFGKPRNGKWKKSQIPGNSRNRDPGFQTLIPTIWKTWVQLISVYSTPYCYDFLLCNEVRKIKPSCNPKKSTFGGINFHSNKKVLSRFSGTTKSNKNLIVTIAVYPFM